MTDYEIAVSIAMMLDYSNGMELFRNGATIITKDGKLSLVAKEQATQYRLKQNGAILAAEACGVFVLSPKGIPLGNVAVDSVLKRHGVRSFPFCLDRASLKRRRA